MSALVFRPVVGTAGGAEIAEVVATLRSEWLTTGPRVKRFEGRRKGVVDAVAEDGALPAGGGRRAGGSTRGGAFPSVCGATGAAIAVK